MYFLQVAYSKMTAKTIRGE